MIPCCGASPDGWSGIILKRAEEARESRKKRECQQLMKDAQFTPGVKACLFQRPDFIHVDWRDSRATAGFRSWLNLPATISFCDSLCLFVADSSAGFVAAAPRPRLSGVRRLHRAASSVACACSNGRRGSAVGRDCRRQPADTPGGGKKSPGKLPLSIQQDRFGCSQ
jgi:hypothetical protein